MNTEETDSQEAQYRENFRNTLFAQSSSEYVQVESNYLYGLLSIKYVQTGNHEESIRGVEFNTQESSAIVHSNIQNQIRELKHHYIIQQYGIHHLLILNP